MYYEPYNNASLLQLVFTQQEKENVIEHEVKENTCKPLVSEIEQPACQQNDISNKPNPLVTINNQPDLSVKVSSFKNETKQQKQQKQKPAMNRKDLNDSSTTSSYTSDDSEDDGSAMVEEWLKQLKVKKSKTTFVAKCCIALVNTFVYLI